MKNIFKKLIEGFGAYFFKHYLNRNKFNPVDKFILEENADSYEHFKKYFSSSMLFKRGIDEVGESIRKYSINQALLLKEKNLIFTEFGVFKGTSTKLFSKILSKFDKKIYCFDSFEGLSTDWQGTSFAKGHFKLNKSEIPNFANNVELVVGDVFNTLEKTITALANVKVCFIHLDLDVHEPTKYVLNKLKSKLTDGAIILFDQIHHVQGWRSEYKALTDTFNDNEYKFIAFSEDGQAAIRYIKK